MFAQAEYPEKLQPEELDRYLEQGWFRMGQTIFTTNFLSFNNRLYSAIWLRLSLTKPITDKAAVRLQKQNARFSTQVSELMLTREKEALFIRYRNSVAFSASPSLDHLLYGDSENDIYNTYEVTIREGRRLIAVGFFDIGKSSAAGIASFYDPDYKKFSLGKYLIYLKINHCRERGLQYFYPGYFVPAYPAFDYKLGIGKETVEFYRLSERQWLPIDQFSSALTPLQVMHDRLLHLKAALMKFSIESSVRYYEFYSANLVPDIHGMELFDFPVFLFFEEVSGGMMYPMVIFDVRDMKYHLLRCRSIWQSDIAHAFSEVYASNLLKTEGDMFQTREAEEMVMALAGLKISLKAPSDKSV